MHRLNTQTHLDIHTDPHIDTHRYTHRHTHRHIGMHRCFLVVDVTHHYGRSCLESVRVAFVPDTPSAHPVVGGSEVGGGLGMQWWEQTGADMLSSVVSLCQVTLQRSPLRSASSSSRPPPHGLSFPFHGHANPLSSAKCAANNNLPGGLPLWDAARGSGNRTQDSAAPGAQHGGWKKEMPSQGGIGCWAAPGVSQAAGHTL